MITTPHVVNECARVCNIEFQIGLNILFEAKRIMCTFAFDFVDYFIQR